MAERSRVAPAVRAVPREFGRHSVVDEVWLRATSLGPGCPLVGVSSADGGVGRSTLVAALGGLLALACPAPVLAVDMTGRAWGGLAQRVGRRHPGTVWDVVADPRSVFDRQVVERLVQRGPTGLHALVGEVEMTVRRRPPVHAEVVAAVEALRAWYPLALLDLPVAEVRGTWVQLGATAAPVLVARATTESVRHTMRLLARLRAVGLAGAVGRCVVVVMATSSRVDREVRAVVRQARHEAGDVVSVPYDPALAMANPIDVRRLARPTRRALVAVAGAVLARCAPAAPSSGMPGPSTGSVSDWEVR